MAQGDVRVRHAHAELRGTGGSVFSLRHPDIVEGSEQVRMVVRDGSTGIELWRNEKLFGLNLGIRPKPRTYATLERAKSKGPTPKAMPRSTAE